MKKKVVTLCLVLALAAIAIAGGTIAYFTDTAEKTNTFTQGKVDIDLTENEWDKLDANAKKLIPGREIVKDPTITVLDGSEESYIFMEVKLSNDFKTLLTDYAKFAEIDITTVDGQKALINKWFSSSVGTNGPKIKDIDMEKNAVILTVGSTKKAGDSVTFFDKVTVPSDVPSGMIKADGNYEIVIKAYAIQAEGLATRDAAFKALFGDEPSISD